jgi:hypothetical protein
MTPDDEMPPGPMVLEGDGWRGEFGGNCPVQGDGEVDGNPFYFRARNDGWTFSVAAAGVDPVDVFCGYAPGFEAFGDYGEQMGDAGWMPLSDAALAVARAVRGFREARS